VATAEDRLNWRGRVLINAQIAAPLFMGHSHRLSKKLHSLLSSIRRTIQTRGHSCTDQRPRRRLGYLCRITFTRRRSSARITSGVLSMMRRSVEGVTIMKSLQLNLVGVALASAIVGFTALSSGTARADLSETFIASPNPTSVGNTTEYTLTVTVVPISGSPAHFSIPAYF